MKIGVVGAGAMGSLFGGHLVEAGEDVIFIDVADKLIEQLNKDGLRINSGGRDRILSVNAGRAESFNHTQDLLIIFTKGFQTEAALRSVVHLIGPETWILVLQNGLGHASRIEPFITREHIIIGMTNFPVDLESLGYVVSRGEGHSVIWHLLGRDDPKVTQVAALLNHAGLSCVASPDAIKAIWRKVAFNASMNMLTALTRCTVGELGDQPAGRQLAYDAAAEVVAVACAVGVRIEVADVRETIDDAFSFHRDHRSSMLQDIRAGRRTENDTIGGAVVAIAKDHGVPTPLISVFSNLMSLLERSAEVRQAASPGGRSD